MELMPLLWYAWHGVLQLAGTVAWCGAVECVHGCTLVREHGDALSHWLFELVLSCYRLSSFSSRLKLIRVVVPLVGWC